MAQEAPAHAGNLRAPFEEDPSGSAEVGANAPATAITTVALPPSDIAQAIVTTTSGLDGFAPADDATARESLSNGAPTTVALPPSDVAHVAHAIVTRSGGLDNAAPADDATARQSISNGASGITAVHAPAGQPTALASGGGLGVAAGSAVGSSSGAPAPPSSSSSATTSAVFGMGWRRGPRLGSAASGESHDRVYKTVDRATLQIFVVKTLELNRLRLVEDKELLKEELVHLSGLRHPRLVQVLGHALTAHHLHIHLEHMPGGSMASMLAEFGPISGAVLCQAVQSALAGLNFLHSREPPVVHGNIKGANLLTDFAFNIKLADFGYSKFDVDRSTRSRRSSLPWTAPEIAQQTTSDTTASDVWSMGCTVIELAAAERPWGRKASLESILEALCDTAGPVPPTPVLLQRAGRAAQDFVRLCLHRDASSRAPTSELSAHRYVSTQASQREG